MNTRCCIAFAVIARNLEEVLRLENLTEDEQVLVLVEVESYARAVRASLSRQRDEGHGLDFSGARGPLTPRGATF